MKILVVAPTPFFSDRGTHIRILEEALALEKLGHQITIATYHIGREISVEVQTSIQIRRIRRLLFWYKKLEAGPDWQKILLDIMLIRKVFNLARTEKFEILHCHIHEGVMLGWIVKVCLFWRKIKIVADFHGSLTREMVSHNYLQGGILKSIFKRVEWFIDNRGDYAITSSWENTEEIKKFRDDKKVETILDGVNLEHYAFAKNKNEIRKELELPEDKIIIVYAGALIPNKGVDNLYAAIKLSLKKNPNLFFVIAGFPAEATKSLIWNNNLQKQIRLISPLNYFQMPQVLLAGDIAIDPKDSQTRQASGKILQYMAAKLPVVCFDRQNNREYLGEGGEYAQDNSAQGLADGILRLAQNAEERKRKGEICFMRAKNFSWDISASKINEIYKNL